jgi:hypothetical protein
MAFYLVSARPVADRLDELEARLNQHAFLDLRPFGQSLTGSLESARLLPNGYFEQISVEEVERGQGWERIEQLPPLFPALVRS